MKALIGWLVALMLTLAPGVRAAMPGDVQPFSQAELDQMLAPIALYPDQLLSQILMAATYPLEVVEAARFQRANSLLQGQDAVRAAAGQDWDPSVQSLLAFPNVLQQMDADIDWTERLGDAFLAQQAQVMDTVQTLRNRALAAGNLRSNDRVQVVHEREIIVLRPARTDLLYVPYYDPLTIYGSWWWPAYRPVSWRPWPGYGPASGYRNQIGFYWGSGVGIGLNFFFGDWDWPTHRVRVVPRAPFYYRRPAPVHHVWVHEHQHRRGHPYRHVMVEHRHAVSHDARPAYRPRAAQQYNSFERRQDTGHRPGTLRTHDRPPGYTGTQPPRRDDSRDRYIGTQPQRWSDSRDRPQQRSEPQRQRRDESRDRHFGTQPQRWSDSRARHTATQPQHGDSREHSAAPPPGRISQSHQQRPDRFPGGERRNQNRDEGGTAQFNRGFQPPDRGHELRSGPPDETRFTRGREFTAQPPASAPRGGDRGAEQGQREGFHSTERGRTGFRPEGRGGFRSGIGGEQRHGRER